MDLRQFRTTILQAWGAIDCEVEELLAYNENTFDRTQETYLDSTSLLSNFLAPAAHLEAWINYAKEAEQVGVYAALKPRLVQLQFPIQAGMSKTEEYQAATRKGISPKDATVQSGLTLHAESQLQLWIYSTLAGPIPVIITGCRDDFVALYQALVKRNEPYPVPASMGACIISGYNNWDRVNRYKHQWLIQHPNCNSEAEWLVGFKQLIPQKERYQDQFILLSPGPYSGVSATELDLAEIEWNTYSLKIRLEHECTHYCTRRFFNSMKNNLLDELIADYMGIVAAIGYYRSDWFLKFVGLGSLPVYRQGGRLENYRGTPSLSNGAFQVLQTLVKQASENLERFDCQITLGDRTQQENLAILMALTQFTLEELASENGDGLIKTAVAHNLQLISKQ